MVGRRSKDCHEKKRAERKEGMEIRLRKVEKRTNANEMGVKLAHVTFHKASTKPSLPSEALSLSTNAISASS